MKIGTILMLGAYNVFNPLLLNIKKNKCYDAAGYTGINLGCGLDNPPDWLGVDGGITYYFVHKGTAIIAKSLYKIFKTHNNFEFEANLSKAKSLNLIHHDLSFGLPFKDNSVLNIYSSHFLEHLSYKDAEYLLKECYRVLKPNGIIRTVVPSLDSEVLKIKEAVIDYENGNYDTIQKYVTSGIVSYRDKYSNHRHMYNYNSLKILMESIGFSNLEENEFKKGKIPDVTLLDTREKSLFVEAKKPF